MDIPTKAEVFELLLDANARNPGPWYQHSLYAAQAAQLIAAQCANLSEERAFALAGLHDIGRREGYTHLHHAVCGYDFMIKRGFEAVARICVTHSFPVKEVDSYFGKQDCSDDELRFLSDYLRSTEYDEYDKLVQLCDAVSAADGFCLVEKRLVDVMARNGSNQYSQAKVEAFRDLCEYFSEKIGQSIYSLLPGVVENTFGIEARNSGYEHMNVLGFQGTE